MDEQHKEASQTIFSLIQAQEYAVARALIHESIRKAPEQVLYYRQLIQLELNCQRPRVALLVFPELIRHSQDDKDLLAWYQLAFRQKQDGVILDHFKTTWSRISLLDLSVAPYHDIWMYALRAALRLRQLDVYERYAQTSIAMKKKYPTEYALEVVYHLHTANIEKAQAVIDEGQRTYSDHLALMVLSGMVYFAKGDDRRAERFFLQAKSKGSLVATGYLIQIQTHKNAD